MKDEMLRVTIEGIRPLLLHNGRLADPLDEYTKRLKVLAKQRDKSDDDHVAVHRVEFEGGLYFDPKMGPYIPADTLQAGSSVARRDASSENNSRQQFRSRCRITTPTVSRLNKGSSRLDGLWSDCRFVFTKGVKVGQKRVSRTRPGFPPPWR